VEKTFESVAEDCPWRSDISQWNSSKNDYVPTCLVRQSVCSEENCAVAFFAKEILLETIKEIEKQS